MFLTELTFPRPEPEPEGCGRLLPGPGRGKSASTARRGKSASTARREIVWPGRGQQLVARPGRTGGGRPGHELGPGLGHADTGTGASSLTGDCLYRESSLTRDCLGRRLPWQEIALARDCLDNLEDTTTISKDPLESWQENTVKEDHLKKRFPWQEITWTRVHSKLLTLDDPAGDYCDLMIMSRIPLLWKHVWNCSYSRYKVIFQISSVLYKDKDHCKHYKVYVYCKLQDFPVGRVSGKVSIIRLLQKK